LIKSKKSSFLAPQTFSAAVTFTDTGTQPLPFSFFPARLPAVMDLKIPDNIRSRLHLELKHYMAKPQPLMKIKQDRQTPGCDVKMPLPAADRIRASPDPALIPCGMPFEQFMLSKSNFPLWLFISGPAH